MNPAEFGLHYHRLCFEVECHRRKGFEFQSFFERIMAKHDPSFIPVRPTGKEGDWKSDGYSSGSYTIYQCYAPEKLTAQKAADKIKTDFDGAKGKWGSKMKCWVFVWSSYQALPPQAVAAIQEIRKTATSVRIEDWSLEGLWNIVKQLPEADRIQILGAIPEIDVAPRTTSAEIQSLLSYLSTTPFTYDSENLALTAIAEKLQRNSLSDSVRAIVTPAVPVAKLVERYASRHPDPNFSARVAQSLVAEYERLSGEGMGAETLFFNLLSYVARAEPHEPNLFWSAAGIVTYYFQLCDIFAP